MTVYLRPEAQEDLNAAADWYERQRPGLGTELLDEVLGALTRIEEAPLSCPHIRKKVRRALIRRFPFGIYYIVEGDDILVLAVMHGRRDPAKWRVRT